MKTKFKPLKKFSALVKYISSGDKISQEENADEWHLVIGRTLKKKKKSGIIFLPRMIPISF